MSEQEKECVISIESGVDRSSPLPSVANGAESGKEAGSSLSPAATTPPPPPTTTDNSPPPSTSHNGDESNKLSPVELFRKLEIIKEIKNKTINLQRIKSKLAHEVDCIQSETKSALSFQSELDLLIQEKQAHLEELRQIQNDISTMENTLKQSDEEKRRALDAARRLHTEYKPLKEQVNQLRELIGLDKTDNNDDEFIVEALLKFESSKRSSFTAPNSRSSENNPKTTNHQHKSSPTQNHAVSEFKQKSLSSNTNNAGHHQHHHHHHHAQTKQESQEANFHQSDSGKTNQSNDSSNFQPRTANQSAAGPHTSVGLGQIDLPVQLATAALMAHSLRAHSPTFSNRQQFQQQPQHFNPFIISQPSANENQSNSNTNSNNEQHIHPLPPPFRQQPPPMKSCLSCHQQIHRNAPICPLCKAKSRSRNPKKPKKKVAETSSPNKSNS